MTAAPAAAEGPSAPSISNPEIALILDSAFAWYSADDALQAGGHDPRRNGFTLQQLELHMASSVDPFFRMEANIVFSQFGVEVEEAYATTTSLPGRLQVRAGQFLTRFGRVNPTHPHTWSFVDQTLLVGKFFGSEGSRGLGAELAWLAPVPWFAEAVVSVTDASGECCARSFYGGSDLPLRSPTEFVVTGALKQGGDLSSDVSLLGGVSAQSGPNASGNGNRTAMIGADLLLRYKPTESVRRSALTWQTEAALRARQVPGDSLRDVAVYSQLVWSINQRWETATRYELASGVDDDPLDPEWADARTRLSAQATFYPSHFSRIRLQTKYDLPAPAAMPIYGVMLATEFMIGAHGAHAY